MRDFFFKLGNRLGVSQPINRPAAQQVTAQVRTEHLSPSSTTASTSFQIISDTHLEAHKGYDTFPIIPKAPYLALLGDIGAVQPHKDEFADFLLRQLEQFKIVFFVPGNHEPYGSNWGCVKDFLDHVVDLARSRREQEPSLGQFVPLTRGRYDFDDDETKVSVLGCILYSNVPAPSMQQVSMFLNDFHVTEDWTVDEHNAQHKADLNWLNDQVASLEQSGRKIVIFTHHSPTTDERANNPRHAGSSVSSGFRTDLSKEKCWTSAQVKLWAFGHTHYNCDFVDEYGKRVYTNQRGYYFHEADGYDGEGIVVV
ncbi:Metallo-dependent phosphatase-like protein [Cladorrhinum sp. PSN259]|nr:Metallo-dependent phosphatase-like protein [Cladorrhinum sp. PSN259]